MGQVKNTGSWQSNNLTRNTIKNRAQVPGLKYQGGFTSGRRRDFRPALKYET